MKTLRINIILPFVPTKPGGGSRIMYEYANRLQQRGHQVTVIHSIRRPFKKMKSPLWWKQFNYFIRQAQRPKWFALHKNIPSLIVPSITDRHIPYADIILSTWWEMTFMTSRLSPAKGKPFNLIQGHEVWAGNEDKVYESYSLPVQHIVIAKYLQQLVFEKSNKEPIHIPLAIDTSVFNLKVPVDQRKNESVLMMYSREEVKCSDLGLQALHRLKELVPSLEVSLFGVSEKPSLPQWITYHQKPSDLPGLYNRHAIFFSPSKSEGWALPPAEAMACGCAVVCTNIGGHADYALDGITALITEPNHADDMAEKLMKLIIAPALRMDIAQKGNEYITTRFNWEVSVTKMEDCFYNAIS